MRGLIAVGWGQDSSPRKPCSDQECGFCEHATWLVCGGVAQAIEMGRNTSPCVLNAQGWRRWNRPPPGRRPLRQWGGMRSSCAPGAAFELFLCSCFAFEGVASIASVSVRYLRDLHPAVTSWMAAQCRCCTDLCEPPPVLGRPSRISKPGSSLACCNLCWNLSICRR